MKNRNLARVLALVLVLCMGVMMLSACQKAPVEETAAPSEAPAESAEPTEAPAEEGSDTPLVVGYSPFSEKFSPFYADTAYDQDVVSMTSISPLTTDRQGAIVYNAIEGETRSYNGTDYFYNGPADVSVVKNDDGTTTYTMKLREDLKWSDGEPLTADDIIFTYYVYCDPAYVGPTTLSSYKIVGLQDYLTQTTSEVYAKYEEIFNAVLKDGEKAGKDADQTAWILKTLDENWAADAQGIVDYVTANYAGDQAEATIGKTADEVTADAGLQNALAMALWGFGSYKDGTLTGASTGKTWDIAGGTTPTAEEFLAEVKAKYEGDAAAYVAAGESAVKADIVADTEKAFMDEFAAKDETMGSEGVPNIAGVKKVDDYTVEVTTEGYEAPAIYSICGLAIAPLHYYGDAAQYDYDNNQFGHPYGDLSMVEAKTTQPLGAGPYKFVKYDNKIVYFEANENYFKGVPAIKNVQFKEGADTDKIPGVGTGTLDLGDPSFSSTAVDEIKGYNSNGELDGDKIVTDTVDNLGYGYIGINAETVNVGGEPASEASKNLRKALATVIAAYREVAIDSYYGERASVINYPISNTSWAAPQKTDADYKVAFSTAVDGSDIFTADMSSEDKQAAALNAAVEYLKAAGYTFDEATGKFTAAPEGAKLEYELMIPADGNGDHPSFMICTLAKQALETIGINLIVNDLSDPNVLWDRMNAGTQELWCAAWGATIDPDMYQVYYSGNIVGLGGSDSNHYHLADAELDQLILEGRASDDQAYRKTVYKAALDKIIDWAVEIPVYQRQNCIIFSAERINMDTVLGDITTFYGWMNGVDTMEMAK